MQSNPALAILSINIYCAEHIRRLVLLVIVRFTYREIFFSVALYVSLRPAVFVRAPVFPGIRVITFRIEYIITELAVIFQFVLERLGSIELPFVIPHIRKQTFINILAQQFPVEMVLLPISLIL